MKVTIEKLSRNWKEGPKGRWQSVGIFTKEHKQWINGFQSRETDLWKEGDVVDVVVKEVQKNGRVFLNFEPIIHMTGIDTSPGGNADPYPGAQKVERGPVPANTPAPRQEPPAGRSPASGGAGTKKEGTELLREISDKLGSILDKLETVIENQNFQGTDLCEIKDELRRS